MCPTQHNVLALQVQEPHETGQITYEKCKHSYSYAVSAYEVVARHHRVLGTKVQPEVKSADQLTL